MSEPKSDSVLVDLTKPMETNGEIIEKGIKNRQLNSRVNLSHFILTTRKVSIYFIKNSIQLLR